MTIKHNAAWLRYKHDGDNDARAEPIREYVALVHYVVARVAVRLPSTLDREDLAAAGTLGLLASVHSTALAARRKRMRTAGARLSKLDARQPA